MGENGEPPRDIEVLQKKAFYLEVVSGNLEKRLGHEDPISAADLADIKRNLTSLRERVLLYRGPDDTAAALTRINTCMHLVGARIEAAPTEEHVLAPAPEDAQTDKELIDIFIGDLYFKLQSRKSTAIEIERIYEKVKEEIIHIVAFINSVKDPHDLLIFLRRISGSEPGYRNSVINAFSDVKVLGEKIESDGTKSRIDTMVLLLTPEEEKEAITVIQKVVRNRITYLEDQRTRDLQDFKL